MLYVYEVGFTDYENAYSHYITSETLYTEERYKDLVAIAYHKAHAEEKAKKKELEIEDTTDYIWVEHLYERVIEILKEDHGFKDHITPIQAKFHPFGSTDFGKSNPQYDNDDNKLINSLLDQPL